MVEVAVIDAQERRGVLERRRTERERLGRRSVGRERYEDGSRCGDDEGEGVPRRHVSARAFDPPRSKADLDPSPFPAPAIRRRDVEVVKEPDELEMIEELARFGINAGDIKKAKEAGYHTAKSIVMIPKKALYSVRGLSEAKVDKMVEAASKLVKCGFITGTEALQKRKQIFKITSGSKAVDDLLGGGIETQSITECFGEYRSGKTQLSHTLAVTTQLEVSQGGGFGKVAVIDTEGAFRPENVIPIAQRYGLDPERVLDNIVTAKAYNTDHQMELVDHVGALCAAQPFRLLIIDSLTALFRSDYSGRGELAERQQKLNQMMSKIKRLADQYNVAVFVTNQVMADPGGGSVFVHDAKKPIGGHILAHASSVRLSLRKGKGESRIIKVIQHPNMPEADATFDISNQGIADSND